MKEEIKYSIELKIDEGIFSFNMPYNAPISAGVDAAMHFYLVMKKRLDDYNKKLDEEGKLKMVEEDEGKEDSVEIKTDDDVEEKE